MASLSQSFNAVDPMTTLTSTPIYSNILVGQSPAAVFQQQHQGDMFLRLKLDDTNTVICPLIGQTMCPQDPNLLQHHSQQPPPPQQQQQPGVTGSDQQSSVVDIGLGQKSSDTTVTPQYECGYCHELLFSDQDLRQHIDMVHTGMRRFPCNICGKAYEKAFLLKNHIKSMHAQIRDVPCTICQKAFCKRSVMKRHMKSVHSDAKNFLCQICSKAFAEKKNLQMHVDALHKGLKPFHCSTCGKDFARKCDLLRHINSVHKESKPFECNYCGKGFPQRWYFERHMLAVHKACPQQMPPTSTVFSSQPSLEQQQQQQQQQEQQQHQMQQIQQIQQQQQQQQQMQSHQTLQQEPASSSSPQQQQFSQHQQQQQHQVLNHQHQPHLQQTQATHHLQLAAFSQSPNPTNTVNIVPHCARFATVSVPTPSGIPANALVPTLFFQQGVLPTHVAAVAQPQLQLATATPQMRLQSLQQAQQSLSAVQVRLQQLPPPQHMLSPAISSPMSVGQTSVVPLPEVSKQKQYCCDLCNKVYPRNQSLQAHRIQVHCDTKPYTCRLCHKGFVRRWDFYRHLNAVHRDRALEALDDSKRDEYLSWMRSRNSSTDISWECLNAVRQDYSQPQKLNSFVKPASE